MVHEKDHKCSDKNKNLKADYVIIGGGSVGGIMAKMLSDSGEDSVIVVERGLNLNDDPIVLDVATPEFQYSDNIFVQQTTAPYSTFYPMAQDVTGVNDPNFVNFMKGFVIVKQYTAGPMWGGSAMHNYAAVGWPNKTYTDYVKDNFGGPRFERENIIQIWNDLQTWVGYTSASPGNENVGQHGFDGPMTISQFLRDPNLYPPGTANSGLYLDYLNFADPLDPVKLQADAVKAVQLANGNDPDFQLVNDQTNFLTCSSHRQIFGKREENGRYTRSAIGNAFLGPDVVDQESGKGIDGRKLQILSGAWGTKVLFKGKKARGVYVVQGNKTFKVCAKKKVIICASVFESPGILERSGIGSEALLSSLGIDPVFINENVGEHFINQQNMEALYATDNVPNQKQQNEMKIIEMFSNIISPGSKPYPNYWLNFLPNTVGISSLPFYALTEPEAEVKRLEEETGRDFINMINVSFLNTTCEGSVHISSTDHAFRPTVFPGWFNNKPSPANTEYDFELVRKSFLLTKQYVESMALADPTHEYKMTFPPESSYLEYEAGNLSAFDSYIWASYSTTAHASGTCKMGFVNFPGKPDDPTCVVDQNFHVRGVDNLMVVDASVIPSVIESFPCFFVEALGVMAAKYLLEGV